MKKYIVIAQSVTQYELEKLTRPEGDELGYSNSSLLDIVMATHGLASSIIGKERKTK